MGEGASCMLISSDQFITKDVLTGKKHAKDIEFDKLISILKSPDDESDLKYSKEKGKLISEENVFWGDESEMLLLPKRLHKYFDGRLLFPDNFKPSDSFEQYFYMSFIKQEGVIGDINLALDNIHYQRHLYRFYDLVKGLKGRILDVGCDDMELSKSLLPDECEYVGLDPFSQKKNKRNIVGCAEYLPFKKETFDYVVFNTSLDHVFDWHRAIDEAKRVLKKNGSIVLSTLVWEESADLVFDSVHFHHFREYEILGGLTNFDVTDVKRYHYKEDKHRYGLYLIAKQKQL